MNNKVQPKSRHMEFRNVVGYFLQDDQNTDSESFNYAVRVFAIMLLDINPNMVI